MSALRYVKAYWSKMEVRDTVLSEEQERRILDQIFKEEEEEQEEVGGSCDCPSCHVIIM